MGGATNRLHFGGDPDHNPDPGFLNQDQDPDPEIFYCPAMLISLSDEDVSIPLFNVRSLILCSTFITIINLLGFTIYLW